MDPGISIEATGARHMFLPRNGLPDPVEPIGDNYKMSNSVVIYGHSPAWVAQYLLHPLEHHIEL